jgi:hypothetical protein
MLMYIVTVPITFKVVSLNPVHGEVYSIQHYVIKLVSDLRHAGRWISRGTAVSSTNITIRHDITEILLKVMLNTITPPIFFLKNMKLENIFCQR